MIIKVFVLVALIRLLYKSNSPFLCSGIYAAFLFIFSLVFGSGFLATLVVTVIGFALASLYFWLLNEFSEGIPHWGIMIGGIFIGLV